MMLRVNGKDIEIEDGATVAHVLHHLGLGASPCAVEVNKALVPKAKHAQHVLQDGDTIEIVTLVGGG